MAVARADGGLGGGDGCHPALRVDSHCGVGERKRRVRDRDRRRLRRRRRSGRRSSGRRRSGGGAGTGGAGGGGTGRPSGVTGSGVGRGWSRRHGRVGDGRQLGSAERADRYRAWRPAVRDFPGRRGRGAGGGFGGGGPGGAGTSSALDKALEKTTTRWAAAVEGSSSAASLELASGGKAVMAMGGFTGSDPAPTLAEFEQWVKAGDITYYIAGGGMGGGPGGQGSSSQITAWVEAHYKSATIGGETVYLLLQPKSTGRRSFRGGAGTGPAVRSLRRTAIQRSVVSDSRIRVPCARRTGGRATERLLVRR